MKYLTTNEFQYSAFPNAVNIKNIGKTISKNVEFALDSIYNNYIVFRPVVTTAIIPSSKSVTVTVVLKLITSTYSNYPRVSAHLYGVKSNGEMDITHALEYEDYGKPIYNYEMTKYSLLLDNDRSNDIMTYPYVLPVIDVLLYYGTYSPKLTVSEFSCKIIG